VGSPEGLLVVAGAKLQQLAQVQARAEVVLLLVQGVGQVEERVGVALALLEVFVRDEVVEEHRGGRVVIEEVLDLAVAEALEPRRVVGRLFAQGVLLLDELDVVAGDLDLTRHFFDLSLQLGRRGLRTHLRRDSQRGDEDGRKWAAGHTTVTWPRWQEASRPRLHHFG